jgi:hypothetical protein
MCSLLLIIIFIFFLQPIAIRVEFRKISIEVDQSENDSANTKLFCDLTNTYFKDLEAFKTTIEALKLQFSATPEGKLSREMRKLSQKIEEEQELQMFKLQSKIVCEVNIKSSFFI